jgi:hypothetical protein
LSLFSSVNFANCCSEECFIWARVGGTGDEWPGKVLEPLVYSINGRIIPEA